MTTPGQDIDAYLETSGTAEPQRLDVAIEFACSMLRELRDSAAAWEQTAVALQEIKQQQQQQQAPAVAATAAPAHSSESVLTEWGPSRRARGHRSGGGGGGRDSGAGRR